MLLWVGGGSLLSDGGKIGFIQRDKDGKLLQKCALRAGIDAQFLYCSFHQVRCASKPSTYSNSCARCAYIALDFLEIPTYAGIA